MSKILVIGQAPPAVTQKVPYDTTMFYDWLAEIGITKYEAQNLFEFEAVSNIFPGHGDSGHLLPTPEIMMQHWNNTLGNKVLAHDKIWIMGNVAWNFLERRVELEGKEVLETMHPSKRNIGWYKANKAVILHKIEMFVKEVI